MKMDYRIFLLLTCVYSGAASAALSREPLSGEAYILADQAYQALARHDESAAEILVVEARALKPDSYQLATMLLNIQMQRGEWEQAEKLSAKLLMDAPSDAALLANGGFIAAQQQHPEQARQLFSEALKNPGLDETAQTNVRNALSNLTESQPKVATPAVVVPAEKTAYQYLEAGYKYLAAHDDAQALANFQQGFALQPGTANQYADAAYAAKRLQQNSVAIDLLGKALDANAALPADQQPFTAQQVFNYRRESQMMNREWGAVAALAYQNNVLTSASQLNTLQGSVEAYWQPNDFAGNRDGHLFQVFTGGIQTLYAVQGGATTGSATAQATLGMRYKPFSSLGMILVAQHMFALGNASTSDTLLQAAYSDGMGMDLNTLHDDWRTWQYYADAAYFVNAHHSVDVFEGNYGQAFHWGEKSNHATWTPHAVFAAQYDNQLNNPTSIAIGLGIKWRYWMREDTHNALASWFEANIQYRHELTNTDRLRGFLMRAIYWY
ncbi:MAG: hypothetical protein WCD45_01970 [Gallionella sp.]